MPVHCTIMQAEETAPLCHQHGAIPRDLIESSCSVIEGAFTGPRRAPPGSFRAGRRGDTLLDEIGDMPMDRRRVSCACSAGEYTTVGGRTPIRSDSACVAATNKDLKHRSIRAFSAGPLLSPECRAAASAAPERPRRRHPGLVRHFVQQAEKEGLERQALRSGGSGADEGASWPGNVRELENLVRRLTALYPRMSLPRNIENELRSEIPDSPIEKLRRARGSLRYRRRSRRTCGSISRALGDALPPSGLYDRVLRKWNIL